MRRLQSALPTVFGTQTDDCGVQSPDDNVTFSAQRFKHEQKHINTRMTAFMASPSLNDTVSSVKRCVDQRAQQYWASCLFILHDVCH